MSLTDLEQDIIAEGKKIRDLAYKTALEVRQSALVKELEKIAEELAAFVEKKPAKATKAAPAKATSPAVEAKPEKPEPEAEAKKS